MEFDVKELNGLIVSISFSKVKKTNGPISETCYRSLKYYLKGITKQVNCPISISGTPFEQAVKKTVMAIPYGETLSYKDVAIKSGYPKAYRAVGGVMAKNTLVIKIPCHRVKAKNGLGGFSGGLDLKEKLLRLESK